GHEGRGQPACVDHPEGAARVPAQDGRRDGRRPVLAGAAGRDRERGGPGGRVRIRPAGRVRAGADRLVVKLGPALVDRLAILGGAGLVVYGVSLIYVPAAVILSGGLLLA